MRKRIALLVVLLTLMATGPLVIAHEEGIHGEFVKNGCACHGSAPSDEVIVTIGGLPSVYNASQAYPLTITVTGGPAASGMNHGGFNLRVGGGALSKNTSDGAVQVAQQNMEATHTGDGTLQYTWNITWTAPETDTYRIEVRAFGNAVNGDDSPAGDMWADSTIHVPGQNWSEPSEDEGLSQAEITAGLLGTGLALFGGVCIILVLWRRRTVPEV